MNELLYCHVAELIFFLGVISLSLVCNWKRRKALRASLLASSEELELAKLTRDRMHFFLYIIGVLLGIFVMTISGFLGAFALGVNCLFVALFYGDMSKNYVKTLENLIKQKLYYKNYNLIIEEIGEKEIFAKASIDGMEYQVKFSQSSDFLFEKGETYEICVNRIFGKEDTPTYSLPDLDFR